MSDIDIENDVERREYQKGEARKYLQVLDVLNNLVKKIRENDNDQKLVTSEIEEANAKLVDLQRFLETEPGLAKRFLHDVGNTAGVATGNLDLYLLTLSDDDAKELIETWDRYKVAVEDNLLRILDPKEIAKEYITEVDFDSVQKVINFFLNNELSLLSQDAKDANSAYVGLDENSRKLKANIDWEALKAKIGQRKIKGNTSVINSLLNILRNPLKQRIDSKLTELEIEVEDDELVLKVTDNGNGMEKEQLDPNYLQVDPVSKKSKSLFIFGEGVSNTGSTGLGLAHLHTRVASMDGELYVVSKRQGTETIEPPTRYQYGGTDEKKDNIKFKNKESGTVFEIRLKLEN